MPEYTLSYTNWVYNCEEWDTLWKWHDNAKKVDLPQCAVPAYMGIHSECKSIRNNSAKLISKLLEW